MVKWQKNEIRRKCLRAHGKREVEKKVNWHVINKSNEVNWSRIEKWYISVLVKRYIIRISNHIIKCVYWQKLCDFREQWRRGRILGRIIGKLCGFAAKNFVWKKVIRFGRMWVNFITVIWVIKWKKNDVNCL